MNIAAIRADRHPENPILQPREGTFYSRAVYNPTVWKEDNTWWME